MHILFIRYIHIIRTIDDSILGYVYIYIHKWYTYTWGSHAFSDLFAAGKMNKNKVLTLTHTMNREIMFHILFFVASASTLFCDLQQSGVKVQPPEKSCRSWCHRMLAPTEVSSLRNISIKQSIQIWINLPQTIYTRIFHIHFYIYIFIYIYIHIHT